MLAEQRISHIIITFKYIFLQKITFGDGERYISCATSIISTISQLIQVKMRHNSNRNQSTRISGLFRAETWHQCFGLKWHRTLHGLWQTALCKNKPRVDNKFVGFCQAAPVVPAGSIVHYHRRLELCYLSGCVEPGDVLAKADLRKAPGGGSHTSLYHYHSQHTLLVRLCGWRTYTPSSLFPRGPERQTGVHSKDLKHFIVLGESCG